MDAWRLLDVDAYTLQRLTAEDIAPAVVPVDAGDLALAQQNARTLMGRGDVGGAVSQLVAVPPYGNSEAEKKAHADAVCGVVVQCKSLAEIKKAVGGLTVAEKDVLVKYLYRVMGEGTAGKDAGVVLNWFDEVVKGGLGGVVRYVCDERRV